MNYHLAETKQLERTTLFLYGDEVAAKMLPLKKDEIAYLDACRQKNRDSLVQLHRFNATKEHYSLWIVNYNSELEGSLVNEKLRRAAATLMDKLAEEQSNDIAISGAGMLTEELIAFVEGLTFANYKYDKYKTKKDFHIENIVIDERFLKLEDLHRNMVLWKHIEQCRNWVNEPVMYLNADKLAQQIKAVAEPLGVKVTIYEQKQIASMKMGGLLAVNRGSVDEARFVVLEYHPADSVNDQPVALVGKGITYDTGGLNIKPEDYMQEMKSDMAGAATMASTLLAAAENHLPVYLMAFLPMTDNRPGFNAYAADDILQMYDGTSVEVVNTDAEGRLILADAIAFSNQFNPELIIDAATLTGAAVRAIGTCGIAAMQQEAANPMHLLKLVGDQVYERIVEFPFWPEYDELIKSEVADIRNCGTVPQAGAITAGKFLAHFAKHPYIHLDIAGVAYYGKKESFYGVGASGYGVRLLYAFFQTYDLTKRKQEKKTNKKKTINNGK